jgi:aldose 1-epimerase
MSTYVRRAAWLAMLLLWAAAAPAAQLSIDSAPFGKMPDGTEVRLYTLTNVNGLRVQVMPFGATIVSVQTPDRDGKLADITLRMDTFDDYLTKRTVLGTVVGRFANRIGGAAFTIDGVEYPLTRNAGKHHIHGGRDGFHRVLWQAVEVKQPDRVGVKMTYTSRDGEEGFPGALEATVVYSLTSADELVMHYEATTDKPTHVNLTNHAYWNLSAGKAENVLGHELTIHASAYLPADDALIPTGDSVPVKDTPLDFTAPKTIGARIDQLKNGYDHCYALDTEAGKAMPLAARVVEPISGRVMEVSTTQPGVQLYTDGRARRALCLETQHYPDAPNRPSFPSTLLRPGETYRQTTIHKFSTLPVAR